MGHRDLLRNAKEILELPSLLHLPQSPRTFSQIKCSQQTKELPMHRDSFQVPSFWLSHSPWPSYLIQHVEIFAQLLCKGHGVVHKGLVLLHQLQHVGSFLRCHLLVRAELLLALSLRSVLPVFLRPLSPCMDRRRRRGGQSLLAMSFY